MHVYHRLAELEASLSELDGETAKERRERNRRENEEKRRRGGGRGSDNVERISTSMQKPPLSHLYTAAGLPSEQFRAFGDWLQAQHGPTGHEHLWKPQQVRALFDTFSRRRSEASVGNGW